MTKEDSHFRHLPASSESIEPLNGLCLCYEQNYRKQTSVCYLRKTSEAAAAAAATNKFNRLCGQMSKQRETDAR